MYKRQQERMLELLCEGLRSVDLIRSGWIAEYLENTNISDYDKMIENGLGNYMHVRRLFQDYRIFYPIPERDVTNTNHIIKQNYGY